MNGEKLINNNFNNSMKVLKQRILLLFSLLLLNCTYKQKESTTTKSDSSSNEVTKSVLTEDKRSTDGLQNFAKKELELNELHIKKDTLEIVSDAGFLFYPFGEFKTLGSLNQALRIFKDSLEIDTSDASSPNKLYRMTYKNSFLKFFYDDEKKTYEIVSGQIHDHEVILVKNIRIGITKSDFINIFFNRVSPEKLKGIKIIKMVSALEGIFDYYYFDNDILTSIKLDTDYLFDKN
ncbi:hypothetical protein [Mucilaginibacter frigoritolerans]|nr:hypothetical protein [Mucilaginibacter frigoritolerans]